MLILKNLNPKCIVFITTFNTTNNELASEYNIPIAAKPIMKVTT